MGIRAKNKSQGIREPFKTSHHIIRYTGLEGERMRPLKHIKLRIKQMTDMGKYIKVDSKFLVIVFFICLIPICISSFETQMSSQGNMITIRTMFSSILGYIIENISNNKNKKDEGKQEDRQDDRSEPQEENKIQIELRVLIVGHILLFITISLIVGAIVNVEQSNQSLVLLKNTVFACIGFLISATKTNINKG